jgi:hypothetical protein
MATFRRSLPRLMRLDGIQKPCANEELRVVEHP